jgi:hypothetical protein
MSKIKLLSGACNLEDPEQAEIYYHAKKKAKNISEYIKRLVYSDMKNTIIRRG